MSNASTIFAFLVVLTGTLVSGCPSSRELDTQSTRRGDRLGQSHANVSFVDHVFNREKNVFLRKSFQESYAYLITVLISSRPIKSVSSVAIFGAVVCA